MPELARALARAKDDSVREAAAEALGRIGGEQAKAALLAILKQDYESSSVCVAVVRSLGWIGDPKVIPVLLREFDHDARDFQNVANALGNIDGPQSVSALLGLMHAESYHVRFTAAEALGQIGDQEAVSPLMEMLRSDRTSAARFAAAESLV